MKPFLLLTILLFSFSCFAQQKEFFVGGKIIDANSNPIPDTHVINYRNLKKVVSSSEGTFNIWVQPGDSLMISHISFFRKKVFADSIRYNSTITLILDTINIIEVHVSPDEKTDYEKAMDNIASIKQAKVHTFVKIKEDTNPVNAMVTEHNELMRSEASSISIYRFSPSSVIDKLVKKRKRRKHSNQYYSTRKKKTGID